MFKNLVSDVFNRGAKYSFDFQGIGCRVSELRMDNDNYETTLHFGNKCISWGCIDNKMFCEGDDFPVKEYKKFLKEFHDFFGYDIPINKSIYTS
jgi:hypothetical protein|nr:MAG TPA: hypothetical protein [Caudoviricetes sp.]